VSSDVENRVLEACKRCCERWGVDRVTIDDIANEAKVSRATLYRMFPGGRDVLFEAMRLKELEEFFVELKAAVAGADSLEDLLVAAVVSSITNMRSDEHLALMMASSPGDVVASMTVEGLPRILRVASVFLTPMVTAYLPSEPAGEVVEVLVRLVISDYLSPSDRFNLADADSTRRFIRNFILPTYSTALLTR
jgi:AcrR family transcriptional regulator